VFVSAVVYVFSAAAFFVYPVRFGDIICAAADETGTDRALIAAIIKAESNFRPDAVSARGAVGLMQLMPETAEFIAVKMALGRFDLRDPSDNIRVGAHYLRYLLDKFGDTRTAVAAYNAGEGNVARWLGAAGAKTLGRTPFAETNAYLDRVFNALGFYRGRLRARGGAN
jgi:soluble lytic murein transglycosylase